MNGNSGNGGNRKRSGGGGGQGGGGNNQRRRRSGGQGGGNQQRPPQQPNGPAMTALGESTYEAVFDHGGQGYGVWFDGVVRDDPMYKQFWKGTGTRPLYVRIEEDRIVLLKEVDIERAPSQIAAENAARDEQEQDQDGDSNPQLADDVDVDAAIEEAVAEAMAAAEAAAADVGGDATAEKVYSPEEAAALFAADAPLDGGAVADDEPVVEKPKRKRAVRKKPEPKAEVEGDSGDE
ncbi:MAG: hypothetical protein H7287_10620 [Thermoleophilia bacterium]|nr:hypothetical protein [Thermoleophilia bacterium]